MDENKQYRLSFNTLFERDDWKNVIQAEISKMESLEFILKTSEGRQKYKEEQIRKYEEQQRESQQRAQRKDDEKALEYARQAQATWNGEVTVKVEGEWQPVWLELKGAVLFMTSMKKRVKRVLHHVPFLASKIKQILSNPSSSTYHLHCIEVFYLVESGTKPGNQSTESILIDFKDAPSKEKCLKKLEEIVSTSKSN